MPAPRRVRRVSRHRRYLQCRGGSESARAPPPRRPNPVRRGVDRLGGAEPEGTRVRDHGRAWYGHRREFRAGSTVASGNSRVRQGVAERGGGGRRVRIVYQLPGLRGFAITGGGALSACGHQQLCGVGGGGTICFTGSSRFWVSRCSQFLALILASSVSISSSSPVSEGDSPHKLRSIGTLQGNVPIDRIVFYLQILTNMSGGSRIRTGDTMIFSPLLNVLPCPIPSE